MGSWFVDFQEAAFIVCGAPLTLILAFTVALALAVSMIRFITSPIRSYGTREETKSDRW